MDSIGKQITSYLHNGPGMDYQEYLKVKRGMQVRSMWQEIVEPVFLEHTNNIYITHVDEWWQLIVYVDEAIFAAELNARRELIKYQFLKQFNQPIDEFKIFVSRERFRENHPFSHSQNKKNISIKALSTEEMEFVDQTVERIQNPKIKEKAKQAMISNMQLENAENEAKD